VALATCPTAVLRSDLAADDWPIATAPNAPTLVVGFKVDALVPMAMDSFPAEFADVPAAMDPFPAEFADVPAANERMPVAALPCPMAIVLLALAFA
jgi:hypothetical protein